MDPNQFQMGKSKLFIKDPASVRFSVQLETSSKGGFGPTGAVFLIMRAICRDLHDLASWTSIHVL